MRVVVYSKPFFPRMGGLERNTLTLSLALSDLGHDVCLFTETCETDDADATYPFRVVRSTSMLDLAAMLRGSDLFLINGNVSLRVIPWAVLQGIPYGIIYHSYWGYRRSGTGVGTRINNRVRRRVAQNATANVFTNSHARTQSDLPSRTSHVVFNPVDKRMEPLYNGTSTSSEDRSFLLFAGRMIAGKGVFVLMDALSQIDGATDLEVLIAGEGPAQAEMHRRSQSLSSIDVTFAGRLDEPELIKAYHQAKALVVPSTTHKEGNPLVVAEAIYAGTPVIASDQPPMVESVGDAGVIVSQGDRRELAQAIRRIYRDHGLHRSLQRKAEQRAEVFSYEQYKQEIDGIVSSTTHLTDA
jgi:glycosyltransferase involved in cell wall biosynthesis